MALPIAATAVAVHPGQRFDTVDNLMSMSGTSATHKVGSCLGLHPALDRSRTRRSRSHACNFKAHRLRQCAITHDGPVSITTLSFFNVTLPLAGSTCTWVTTPVQVGIIASDQRSAHLNLRLRALFTPTGFISNSATPLPCRLASPTEFGAPHH